MCGGGGSILGGDLSGAIEAPLKHVEYTSQAYRDDPERAFLGINTPFESKLWGGILGKDYEPTTNVYGGATDRQKARMQRDGINTDLSNRIYDVADTIAAYYGGQAIGGAVGGAAEGAGEAAGEAGAEAGAQAGAEMGSEAAADGLSSGFADGGESFANGDFVGFGGDNFQTPEAPYQDYSSAVDFETPASSDVAATDYSGIDTSEFQTPETPYQGEDTPVDFGGKRRPIKSSDARLAYRLGRTLTRSNAPTPARGASQLQQQVNAQQRPQRSLLSSEQKQQLQNIAIVQIINKYAKMGRNPWSDTGAQQEMQNVINKYS